MDRHSYTRTQRCSDTATYTHIHTHTHTQTHTHAHTHTHTHADVMTTLLAALFQQPLIRGALPAPPAINSAWQAHHDPVEEATQLLDLLWCVCEWGGWGRVVRMCFCVCEKECV